MTRNYFIENLSQQMIKFDKIKFWSKWFKMHFKPFLMKKIFLSLQAKNGLWDLVSGRVGPPETKSQVIKGQKNFFAQNLFWIILSNFKFFYHFFVIYHEKFCNKNCLFNRRSFTRKPARLFGTFWWYCRCFQPFKGWCSLEIVTVWISEFRPI